MEGEHRIKFYHVYQRKSTSLLLGQRHSEGKDLGFVVVVLFP